MPVYVLAASGATHFLEKYASAREAADDMGVAVQTMNNAVCQGHRGGRRYWTRDEPAGGQDPSV